MPSDAPEAEEQAVPSLVGRSLGHFRVDALLGRGGMGAVYRGFDTSLQRPVAIKVLLEPSSAARTRFVREARAQAQIRHPNVVPIHYVGEHDEITFIVMDLVDGESLADILHREGSVPPERALDVCDAIASALEAGWESGLVHRDVKPSNILVDKRNRVLLADFGLAKAAGSDEPPMSASQVSPSAQLTHVGAIVGTPAYLAPEQASGAQIDHRADIYALGVTLYEALVGQRPFTGETPTALVRQHKSEDVLHPRVLAPTIRPALESLVLRMMQKRPEDRFPTYAELRAAIAASREVQTITAPFFPRMVAFLVDLLVLSIPTAILSALMHTPIFGWIGMVIAFAILEHGWGTPGKKLLRLRTIDRHGERPSTLRSIYRWTIKVWGLTLAMLCNFLPPRIGDAIAVVVILGWFVTLLFALGSKRLALHDRITGTRTIYEVK